MDLARYSADIRALVLAPSRREVLRGLAGAGIALTALRMPGASVARKKHKRKRRKPKQRAAAPNAFGCIDVGELCQRADQCCSGICAGKKGKQTCHAHDVGDCPAGAQSEKCGGANVACTTSGGAPGVCGTTTGNAGFCSTYRECYFCTTDVDCQLAAGGVLGPRAACIQCASCPATGGAACASRDYISPSPKRQEEGHGPLHGALD